MTEQVVTGRAVRLGGGSIDQLIHFTEEEAS